MSIQPEAALEEALLVQLQNLDYERISLKNEVDLENNLKKQIEIHNKISLNDNEFKKILNHLNKGTIFDKAKTLRDKFALNLENGDIKYIEFLNTQNWCQNTFQVSNQITVKDKYENRYDVTILINGLPLVQIELKRRGIEIKEAFNQIKRYKKESFGANNALFNFLQIFIVSNGVNTKYFVNTSYNDMLFSQTFLCSFLKLFFGAIKIIIL